MTATLIASLKSIGEQLSIYGGIIILAGGIVGGLFNIIVFLSLKTFRQSSCTFYLILMSIFNIGQLLTGLLSRILLYIYNDDGTDTSLFYCKFRLYLSHLCAMLSLTCFCLATIDQYCATSSHRHFQKFCNIKFAQYSVIIFSFLWILHGIPYILLSYHQISSDGQTSCTMTNTTYLQYRTYFIVLILYGFLPIAITSLFGLIAWHNVQQLRYYTVPIVRRELDKQLTTMVLVQVIINIFTLLPYAIANIISLNMENSPNLLIRAQVQLTSRVTLLLYYVYYANSFYIYMCASERFRRQLIYVLFKIYWKQCREQEGVHNNQILPQA